MARLIIDLTKYVDRFGSRLPEGRYLLRVDWTDVGKTSTTPSSTMVTVGLSVAEGPHEGQSVVDRLVLNDKAMFRTVAFLQGLGIKTPRQRLEVDPDTWKGLTVVADLVDGKPYRDKIKSEVSGYLPKAEADAWRASGAAATAATDGDGLDEFLPPEGNAAFAEAADAGVSREEAERAIRELADDVNLDDIAL